MIPVHWMTSPNFGDYLSKYIPEKLTGDTVNYVTTDSPDPHYIVSGSVLGASGPNTTVWGAGFGNCTDKIIACKELLAVRGPRSLQVIESQGLRAAAIGDPAFIMPRLYNPTVTKKYKLGVIPHWIDYYVGMMRFRDCDDTSIIDILRKPEEVIDRVLECEYCISSSLHGWMIANAYGIPCMWVTLGDRLCGDGFKFQDYFALANEKPYDPPDVRYDPISPEELCKLIAPCPEINSDRLWDTCPFK